MVAILSRPQCVKIDTFKIILCEYQDNNPVKFNLKYDRNYVNGSGTAFVIRKERQTDRHTTKQRDRDENRNFVIVGGNEMYEKCLPSYSCFSQSNFWYTHIDNF